MQCCVVGDERVLCAECFPERSDEYVGNDVGFCALVFFFGSKNIEGVCFVDDQCCVVCVAYCLECGEVGFVGVYVEVVFDDDDRVWFFLVCEDFVDCFDVDVGNDGDASFREASSVDDRGVVQSIADDQVAGPGEGGEETDVGGVPVREDEGVVDAELRSERAFDGAVLVLFAGDQARGAGPGGCVWWREVCEFEIVVRAE